MDSKYNKSSTKDLILNICVHKQVVYSHIQDVYKSFETQATQYVDNLESYRHEIDNRVDINIKIENSYEFWLKVGGDTLVFIMHTNVFSFPSDHPYQKTKYVLDDPKRAYCGMIEVYNFLSDTIKYNRVNDVGELVARIFVNSENSFFLEATNDLGKKYRDYGLLNLDDAKIYEIIEDCVIHSIKQDLWVPPFDQIQYVPYQYMLVRQSFNPPHPTSKRLGFEIKSAQSDIEVSD